MEDSNIKYFGSNWDNVEMKNIKSLKVQSSVTLWIPKSSVEKILLIIRDEMYKKNLRMCFAF